jgi:hypothetical protein
MQLVLDMQRVRVGLTFFNSTPPIDRGQWIEAFVNLVCHALIPPYLAPLCPAITKYLRTLKDTTAESRQSCLSGFALVFRSFLAQLKGFPDPSRGTRGGTDITAVTCVLLEVNQNRYHDVRAKAFGKYPPQSGAACVVGDSKQSLDHQYTSCRHWHCCLSSSREKKVSPCRNGRRS